MALVGSFSCKRTSAKTFMLFCFNLVVNWFESCKKKKYRVSLLTEGSRARYSFDRWNNDETWARKVYLPLSSPHCPHRWSRPHATRMLWRTLFLVRLVMPLMLSSGKSWGASLVFSQVPNRWFHKKTTRNKRNRIRVVLLSLCQASWRILRAKMENIFMPANINSIAILTQDSRENDNRSISTAWVI